MIKNTLFAIANILIVLLFAVAIYYIAFRGPCTNSHAVCEQNR